MSKELTGTSPPLCSRSQWQCRNIYQNFYIHSHRRPICKYDLHIKLGHWKGPCSMAMLECQRDLKGNWLTNQAADLVELVAAMGRFLAVSCHRSNHWSRSEITESHKIIGIRSNHFTRTCHRSLVFFHFLRLVTWWLVLLSSFRFLIPSGKLT